MIYWGTFLPGEKLSETLISKLKVDLNILRREKIGRGEWIRTTDLLVPNQGRKKNQ